jgi:hypothetical protein
MMTADPVATVRALLAQLDDVHTLIESARWDEATALIAAHDVAVRALFTGASFATTQRVALRDLLAREREVIAALTRARAATADTLAGMQRNATGMAQYSAVRDG